MKLIFRAMKSNPFEALKSKLNIAPIDLRLKKLQGMEAIKLIQKLGIYKNLYKNNKWKTNNSTNALNITLKTTPYAYLKNT